MGTTSQNSEKNLRNDSVMDECHGTRMSWMPKQALKTQNGENTPINAKKTTTYCTETKRILNIKISAKGGPAVFTFSWSGGAARTPAPRLLRHC